MAEPGTEIPFTVGDQERMKGIEDQVGKIDKVLEAIKDLDKGLPCKQQPPICTQEPRITTLENAHKRGKWISGSIIVAMVVYFLQLITRHMWSQ